MVAIFGASHTIVGLLELWLRRKVRHVGRKFKRLKGERDVVDGYLKGD